MLKKICRCGKVIPYSIKRCPECEVKAEEERKQHIRNYKINTYERDSKYNKFYKSKEWNTVRQLAIVRDHALCKDCLDNNVITPYNTVHHRLVKKIRYKQPNMSMWKLSPEEA